MATLCGEICDLPGQKVPNLRKKWIIYLANRPARKKNLKNPEARPSKRSDGQKGTLQEWLGLEPGTTSQKHSQEPLKTPPTERESNLQPQG